MEPWVVLFSVSQNQFHIEPLSDWQRTGRGGGGYDLITKVADESAARSTITFLLAFHRLAYRRPQKFYEAMVEAYRVLEAAK